MLNVLQTKIQNVWVRLNPREQMMVGGMIAFLLIVGGVWGVIIPMNQYIERTERQVQALDAQDKLVKLLAKESKTLKSRSSIPVLAAKDMEPILWQLLGVQKVDLGKLNMSVEDNQLKITGELGFDQWIAFVGQAASQSQIYLQSAQVSAAPQPGIVKVIAVFAHAGGTQ